jgi:ribosomal protein L17
MDAEEKRALRKNGLFTEAQLMKYRKWFNAMDSDKSGSVNVEELSSVLLSSGIMKYKYEVENMFRAADADRSGEISFEEFVSGIGSTIASGKLQLHRLDALVDETNVLSAETMLSQARREILMEHIINQTTQRAAEIEKLATRLDDNPKRGSNRRRQETISAISMNELKSHRTLESLVGHHQLHRMKSMQTISHLSQVLSAEISRKDSADLSSTKPLHATRSAASMQQLQDQEWSPDGKGLVPLESILHPSLWDLIDPALRTLPDQVANPRSLSLGSHTIFIARPNSTPIPCSPSSDCYPTPLLSCLPITFRLPLLSSAIEGRIAADWLT